MLPSPADKPEERPLLFLDVDGVLNCIEQHEVYDRQLANSTEVWVPPGTNKRVARLLEAFDPVWATAWLGSAHSGWRDILALDGMPWPYLVWNDLKLPHILRMAGSRRWAWVDDDAGWELKELDWTRDTVAGLIIAPDHETGLTDDHVTELLEWASPVHPGYLEER